MQTAAAMKGWLPAVADGATRTIMSSGTAVVVDAEPERAQRIVGLWVSTWHSFGHGCEVASLPWRCGSKRSARQVSGLFVPRKCRTCSICCGTTVAPAALRAVSTPRCCGNEDKVHRLRAWARLAE